MFVYIIANKNTHPTLYTGVTNNLQIRILEHMQETIKGFIQKHHLHNLVYYETIEGSEQAIIREKQIKNMAREEKLRIIKVFNPTFRDLYHQLPKDMS